jgi:hypothetical protein
MSVKGIIALVFVIAFLLSTHKLAQSVLPHQHTDSKAFAGILDSLDDPCLCHFIVVIE